MDDVIAARARAAAARARLSGTIDTLQTRLSPRALARDTVDSIADSSERALRNGADTVRRNPGLAAGVVALAGLWLARDRVKAMAASLRPGRRAPAKPPQTPSVRTTRARPAPAKRKPS